MFCNSRYKRKDFWCIELGAEGGTVRNVENFADAVAKWTDNNGVQVILDPVGANYLEDNNADPSEIIEKEDSLNFSVSNLYEAIKKLDDRSRDIIYDRWLSDEKLTLHELADKYEVSAERVRQIEEAALKKVKQSIAAE